MNFIVAVEINRASSTSDVKVIFILGGSASVSGVEDITILAWPQAPCGGAVMFAKGEPCPRDAANERWVEG